MICFCSVAVGKQINRIKITEPSGERHKNGERFPLRLQNGCLPDQVPLGKHILSAEPYSVCPTVQVKRTLLRTLKFPASRLAWAGVPGSPQVSAESPATQGNQSGGSESREGTC